MDIPRWALIMMWIAGLVGTYMLTREMIRLYL
jgi:hypothetical protein